MERQFDLGSWDELESRVRELVAEARGKEISLAPFSHFLFRGHGSDEWSLETTLDRWGAEFNALSDYYRLAAVAKTQIETFTSRSWEEVDYSELLQRLENYDSLRSGLVPHYDYLVYLRHHGFPSPLLDWSRSLYIAAYFAFSRPVGDRAAIFMYQEYAGSGKFRSSNEPQLLQLGPNVRSHPRHFLQQGEYTMCVQFIDGAWRLGRHSDVFNLGRADQDRLIKFTVPSSESQVVMSRLQDYNINAFSLFQSEEALLETLARRLIPKAQT